MDPILVIIMMLVLMCLGLFVASLTLLLIKPYYKTANVVISLLMLFIALFALSALQYFSKDKQYKNAVIAFFVCVIYIVMPILLLSKNPPKEEEPVE